jgi:hypothetical protein
MHLSISSSRSSADGVLFRACHDHLERRGRHSLFLRASRSTLAISALLPAQYLGIDRTATGKKNTRVEAGCCEPVLFGWTGAYDRHVGARRNPRYLKKTGISEEWTVAGRF